MKTNILVDVSIVCDPPRVNHRNRSMEDLVKIYEEWIRDFESFMRDHRSQDPVCLNVNRTYIDICSYCKNEWDEDENGCPCCCDEAAAEFEINRIKSDIILSAQK